MSDDTNTHQLDSNYYFNNFQESQTNFRGQNNMDDNSVEVRLKY